MPTGVQGRGGKRRKVSPPEEGELRDEEEEEEGEGRRGAGKKIKLTEKDFKEDEFTPFSYGGVDFADYTTGTKFLYTFLSCVHGTCGEHN